MGTSTEYSRKKKSLSQSQTQRLERMAQENTEKYKKRKNR